MGGKYFLFCYQIQCVVCEKSHLVVVYIGETSRSAYQRVNWHLRLFLDKKEGCDDNCLKLNNCTGGSELWKNSKIKHQGLLGVSDWKVKVVSSHRSALGCRLQKLFTFPGKELINCWTKRMNLIQIIWMKLSWYLVTRSLK